MKSSWILVALVVTSLLFACAPTLPQKDIDAANAAFEAAKTAKAEAYAPESFQAAASAQAALQAEIDTQSAKKSGKSFKAVPALAKTLLEAAKKAETDAAAGLEAAKSAVAGLLPEIEAALGKADAGLALARKAGKKAKVNVATVEASLAAARTEFDAAKAANDSGDFAAALGTLGTLKDSVLATLASLETAGYKVE